MGTRGRLTTGAATPRRAAGSLALVVLLSGAAVGSAHGVATATSQEAALPAGPGAPPAQASVAPVVSFSAWDTAVALGDRPVTARPLRSVPTSPVPVPPAALNAYHRSAAVLAQAAPRCGLDWSLLAALGHVESDHGGRSGSGLDPDGVARPGIVGPPVTAPGGGPAPDTDGGELDGRVAQDRAVGPMQLLPSVWSAAAVDGDGDGLRNPQDIDDAALAAGVLLCTSAPELDSAAGRSQALRRYNPTPGYVDLVQRLAAAYARTAVPPGTLSPVEVSATAVMASDARGDGPAPGASATPAEVARLTGPAAPSVRHPTARTRSATARPAERPGASPVADSALAAASAPATPTTLEEPEAGPSAETSDQGTEPAEAQATGADQGPHVEPGLEATPSPEPTSQPTPTSTSEPDPTPSPEEASIEPSPTGAAESLVVTVTGVWAASVGHFLVDDTVVGIGAVGDLTAQPPTDLDGDGTVETVAGELDGLAGARVEVVGTPTGPDSIALGSLDDLRRATDAP